MVIEKRVSEDKDCLDGLSKDERRLIRMFRCMNRNERNDTLVDTGKRLMERFSVNPFLSKYTREDPTYAEEMSPEEMERYDQRLRYAAPMPDGRILCWENLGDPGQFIEDTLEEVCEVALGTSEYDEDTACYLAQAYLYWLDDYNWIQHPKNYYSEEEIQQYLPEDFNCFIREWRERVLRTIEKQAGAADHKSDESKRSRDFFQTKHRE